MSDETTLGEAMEGWRAKIPAAALALADELGPLEPDTPEDVRREIDAMRGQQAWDRWCRMVREHYGQYADGERALDYLGDLEPGQHPEDLRRWAKGTSKTLILHGPVGRGKTHAAIGLGYQEASMGVHTTIISQAAYLAALRPGGVDEPYRYRLAMARTSLLILDDLGAETEDGTRFVREEMCALFDARVNNGVRTIITTNATPAELVAAFGARIISRIRDDSVGIEITGRDRRQARKADDPW